MSQDPVMQAPFWTQGLNRYSYAFNDPVNNTDPSGFISVTLGLIRVGDFNLIKDNGTATTGATATGGATTASQGTTAASAGLSTATVGVGLSVLGNVLDTALTGGPLDGSRAGGTAVSVATPSAHPRGTGSGTNSTQAKNQNSGQPGPPFKLAAGGADPYPGAVCDDGGCHHPMLLPPVDLIVSEVVQVVQDMTSAAQSLWRQLRTPTAEAPGVRAEPRNQAEELTLQEAKGGAGERIMKGEIKDPKFPEDKWAKMQHVHVSPNGSKIVVHYWERLADNFRTGFKFKEP